MKPSKIIIVTVLIFIVPFFIWAAASPTGTGLDKAYELLKEKKYAEALGLFESYLEKKPGDARIHLETAYVYVKVKNDSKALEHFLAHARLTKAKPAVQLEIGYLYLRLNNSEKAEPFFKSYTAAEPNNIDAAAQLAFLQLKLGKKKEAAERMEAILKRDPNRETVRLNLAYLLFPRDEDRACVHFRVLARSKNPETRKKATEALRNRSRAFGYMFEGILYHSFRFDINVLSLNARVYYKRFPLRFLEPYVFMQLSTDAESTLNPFPTIYSEQAVLFGAGLQWYPYRRNVRIYAQYGFIKKFLEVPGWKTDDYTLSYGVDSFFRVPLDNRGGYGWGLELNNSLAFHSRFDDDWMFYGKEILYATAADRKTGYFRPYAGIVGRWDSKKYFYNNNLELIAGFRWSLSKNFIWYAFAEYSYGNYFKDTFYGKDYHELIAGIIVGIYK